MKFKKIIISILILSTMITTAGETQTPFKRFVYAAAFTGFAEMVQRALIHSPYPLYRNKLNALTSNTGGILMSSAIVLENIPLYARTILAVVGLGLFVYPIKTLIQGQSKIIALSLTPSLQIIRIFRTTDKQEFYIKNDDGTIENLDTIINTRSCELCKEPLKEIVANNDPKLQKILLNACCKQSLNCMCEPCYIQQLKTKNFIAECPFCREFYPDYIHINPNPSQYDDTLQTIHMITTNDRTIIFKLIRGSALDAHSKV